MNQPAALPFLRPMRVAELLDATIRLYRKNFLTFVAIVAVIQVPLLVVNGALSIPMAQATEQMTSYDPYSYNPETFDPNAPPTFPFPPGFGRYFLWLGIQLLASATLGLVGTSLMTGALAWAVSERHLERPVTVGRAYRAVLRRWKPLLGAALLTLGLYLLLYIFLFVPCIGQIAGIPALAFTYVCLQFVPQAVMLEEQRAAESLRRSWYLTKPYFWRVLGIVALLWLFSMLIAAGPSYLVSLGSAALPVSYVVRTLIVTAIGAVLGLLYIPIRLAGETLVYYDLRVRAEGLDLEMELDALTEDLEPVEPALSAATGAAEPFLSRRDWRNLAILAGVGLVVVILCCAVYFLAFAAFSTLMMPDMEHILQEMMTVTPVP
jgi:hypothetical protein